MSQREKSRVLKPDEIVDSEKSVEELESHSSSLDQQAASSKHKRSERSLNILSWLYNLLIAVIVGSFISVIVVFLIHQVATESVRWLDDEDVANLKTFLFSGAVIGIIHPYLKSMSEKLFSK